MCVFFISVDMQNCVMIPQPWREQQRLNSELPKTVLHGRVFKLTNASFCSLQSDTTPALKGLQPFFILLKTGMNFERCELSLRKHSVIGGGSVARTHALPSISGRDWLACLSLSCDLVDRPRGSDADVDQVITPSPRLPI